MRIIGKLLVFLLSIYLLIVAATVAYQHFGLLGVIGAMVPLSLLIAPIYLLIATGELTPLVIASVGLLIIWWLYRGRTQAAEQRLHDELIHSSNIESAPQSSTTGQNKAALRRPRTREEVKQKLNQTIQALDKIAQIDPPLPRANSALADLSLDELYDYAAAYCLFMGTILAKEMMRSAGEPAIDLAIPAKMLKEYDKWHQQLYRAERGLPLVSEAVLQVADNESEPDDLSFLLERLSGLKDLGSVTAPPPGDRQFPGPQRASGDSLAAG